jgi:hypothetical protein
MPSYVLPQVLVYQEFAQQPVALAQPQNVVVIGPNYDLFRYTEERTQIKVTDNYDPLNETCYSWPGRQAGGVVDFTYTAVFMEDALLKYFNDPSGDASTIRHVDPGKNRIRASNLIFKTANGFTRTTSILRDVQIGDVVKLLASACENPVTFFSEVVGLVADEVASIIDSAVSDTGNQAAVSAATSGVQTEGYNNRVDLDTLDGVDYNGLADGEPSEVYTVEVVGASVGGDATTGILRVTSASGKDDVLAVTPAAFGAATPIGTRGLEATFINTGSSSSSSGDPDDVDQDDFQIGQKWRIEVSQDFTPPTPASGGTYVGTEDTTYIVDVTRGGLFTDTDVPQVSVTTTTGTDISGPTNVPAAGTAVAVGTGGVTIAFSGSAGLNEGDRYTIPVTAATDGATRTLVLANNLPDALRGECDGSSSSAGDEPDLDLTLYVKKNIEVTEERTGYAPLVNWEQEETQICLKAGIVAYDADFVSGGSLVALPVEDGAVYVQHRDQLTASANLVSSLSDVSDVVGALGTISPDNDLAFGVYKALENSNGEDVFYVPLNAASAPTLTEWLEALDVLVGRDDVYSIVPLSQDKEIHDAVLAHVNAQSTPERGRWRICWLNRAAEEVLAVYTADGDGDALLATLEDDPDATGTQYTLLEVVDGELVTNGVRAGDTVRYLYTGDGFGNQTYSEFVVDSVINEETIRLQSGPDSAELTPRKVEFHRTLTKDELATELATYPGEYSSRRAYLVWPDVTGNAGVSFPGYFMCAGLAGLRSASLPHQGLTNVALSGFDDLTRTTEFFSDTQLNTMAASGYWIVTQDPNDGTIFTRHQLSTGNQDDINEREQNITTNMDNISRAFLLRMKQYIGRGNVTPTMINILRGEIVGVIEQYKNTIISDILGPQILEAEITRLAPDETYADRIRADIDIDLPEPFNNLELHLVA